MLIEEQPRAMLTESVNNAITMVKRIQGAIAEDEDAVNQVIEQLHKLQTIPASLPASVNSSSVIVEGNGTPGVSVSVSTGAQLRQSESYRRSTFPERLLSCESEMVTTGCDEESKLVL